MDYSFRLARQRRGKLTLCHKKNSLIEAGNLWQDTVNDLSLHYPEVDLDYVHVDAMFFHLPVAPERFDGVVTDNLFGRHHRRPGRRHSVRARRRGQRDRGRHGERPWPSSLHSPAPAWDV
ncbi:isocitrate/isopropylmalate family dehydrogenase [Arthrobacter sp. A5]|uniref:isocitrate/isopropylmalate family dehydrogenase n=1 Tax=Arthrobacter sp. A5 TaxID=576926 RepID=UPI003DA83883